MVIISKRGVKNEEGEKGVEKEKVGEGKRLKIGRRETRRRGEGSGGGIEAVIGSRMISNLIQLGTSCTSQASSSSIRKKGVQQYEDNGSNTEQFHPLPNEPGAVAALICSSWRSFARKQARNIGCRP